MGLPVAHVGVESGEADGPPLAERIREVYADLRLVPLLYRLIMISRQLLGGTGGSISIVDSTGQHYLKVAERGTSCMIGQSFPVREGITGRALASRRPVVLASYRDIENGHIPLGDPAHDGAAVAVPMWWRGEVIGANVVFAGVPRSFHVEEIDQLDAITAAALPGIVMASASDPSLCHLVRRGQLPVSRARSSAEPVSRAKHELVLAAQRADRWRPVGKEYTVDLARTTWGPERSAPPVAPAPVPGQVDQEDAADAAERGTFCSLTGRELEVIAMLARGLSNRSVAAALAISAKTVEKHVGTILRKTGTTNRTGAVALALEAGWLH